MKIGSLSRIRLLSLAVIGFGLILIGKLYIVQIVRGKAYTEKAERQYVQPNQSVFDRGTIFFETKTGTQISAATLKEGYTLVMDPKLLVNSTDAYAKLNEVYPIDFDTFFAKASKTDDQYEELGKKIDSDTGIAINELGIGGIYAFKDAWRYYPGDSLAAQTIGLVGFNKDNVLAGRYGLERYYESILTRNSNNLYVNFFAEVFSNIRNTIKGQDIQGDIVATIEPSVQNYLESVLQDTEKKWHADSLGAIIINPMNGEIYAMASSPTYNENDLSAVDDPKILSNPLVEDAYEMGSIIKPLTMAVGLDSGAVTASTTYEDTGSITLNGKKISNYDGKARGVIPMQEILNQSLNLGATFVALKTGHEVFANYFSKYGLGQLTGIDQPNEQVGSIVNLKSPRDVEFATASFGQGIAMTPIQTARALSVLGNGGYLIKPHLVKRIDYSVGFSKVIDTTPVAQVLKTETSHEITRMLVQVVDKALKNGIYKNKNYSVAAKTGTAQIADRVNGGYYTDRYLHSFFGYFPAYNPQFLIFLYHINPKGAQYASDTLTIPFIDLTKFLINYYNVPPDR